MGFALLVPYEGQDASDRLAGAVYDRFQMPWNLDGVSVVPGAVFAEFIYKGREENAEDILEMLNFSLAQAKTCKGRMLRFSPPIYQKMEQQSRIMKQM